ncbi:MAG TPA: hypothetical protein VFV33_16810, partial [Gemmatimonadaceae bacterium]|nr:hypothetical protein [Gemmatimonadaceae bacterium]
MILGAVRRLRELPRAQPSPELDARLHRIEAAVEAIRIDVERLAEAKRLEASREVLRLPEPGRPPRVITPH